MTQVLIDSATLEQLVGALEAVLDDHEDLASCEARHELRTALAQHREQQPVCHGCGIPAGDVHMSTCKSGKWPSRVSNGDTAAPAPQAQSILASAVLALNTLWNKSSVKDSAIADQLAVCRVLAESDDDMELTDAQILALWEETYVQRGWTGIEFARAIERAHGIGVKP